MFQLTSPTDAALTSVTPRTETHGDEKVFAISLGIKLTGPNTLLDALSPTLRSTLYKAVEDQDQLPGVEPSTPLLRSRGIDVVHLVASFEGWTLSVAHGIDEDEPITLGGCKVDKFRVSPKEGGSVDLMFRIGSNDIDATEAGLLCSKLSQSISITLLAPPKPEQAIDGSTEAFEKDHPEAGDLFAASAGPEDADSEGGEPDVSVGWPFPKDAAGEAPPQSVTVEQSQPGTRTARGRERTKAALAAGGQG